MQFRCNEPTIAFEVLDDDVVLINFDTGAYYSIAGCGADIWSGLLGGMTVAEIADRLSASVAMDKHQVTGEVERFINDLVKEQLIVSADGNAPAATAQDTEFTTTFTPPQLQKFTDMQDLILLDPVHDVSEEGWPIAKGEDA